VDQDAQQDGLRHSELAAIGNECMVFVRAFLFAIYLDDLSEICTPNCGRLIILFADDILSMSYSVVDLEKLIRLSGRELIL